jgi:hypothetical protein
MTRHGRDLALVGLLAILPVLAHAPAWTEGRLLGPGDGAALHFPLRVAVWRAYAAGEVPSWNPGIFSGTPLLASYRPGAFFPLTVALALLPEFAAFQVLVLVSLALAAVLLFLYLRTLGASRSGAYAGGLFFSLGPVLGTGLGDTARVAAAPMVVLVLLALERRLARPGPWSALGLAAAAALVILAGSPEASAAALALALGRLLLRLGRGARGAWVGATIALGCGVLLAAPQLVPTTLALLEAGPGRVGWAEASATLPGVAGLLVRYVSHTPAPALSLAALPLLVLPPVRAWALALALALPASLLANGLLGRAASLVLELGSCALAGLVLSAHGRAREAPRGLRVRAYVLVAGLGGAAALSVATTLTGPLPEILAGAVGVLALALILFLVLGGASSFVKAHVFLLPLTVSFLLQPHGRAVWEGAPSEDALYSATPTRQALDRAMRGRREERVLGLVRDWPREAALDLGYAGLGAITGRRSANGYDPLVPARRRSALGGMSEAGTLPASFLRTDPARLDFLGVRFVEVEAADLVTAGDANGLGDALDLVVDPARPRYFPLPIIAASEVRIESSLSDAVLVPEGTPVARVSLRLASGRILPLPLRAGLDTAEWAFDRPDVRPRMRHGKAPVLGTFAPPGAAHRGLRYLGILKLPGRYLVDGVYVEGLAGGGRLSLFRMGLKDAAGGRVVGVSAAAGYLSDAGRFREAAATPLVRLMELRASLGRARVVDQVRRFATEAELLAALGEPVRRGIDPRREALSADDGRSGPEVPEGSRTSRAVVARQSPSTLELRAEGPGFLVVTEGWDGGWKAWVDDRLTRVFRVNATHLGLVLEAGTHRVRFAHRAQGLREGLVLAGLGGLGLLGLALKERALTPSKSAS